MSRNTVLEIQSRSISVSGTVAPVSSGHCSGWLVSNKSPKLFTSSSSLSMMSMIMMMMMMMMTMMMMTMIMSG